MEDLEIAGLTRNESIVYQTLVEIGPSLAGQISRKSGIHRRTVYDVIATLTKKGLVGYILENNRRVFKAESPERILEIINEKERLLKPAIERLSEKYKTKRENEITLFYRGKEGLKSIFEDQLRYSEILVLGANKDASKILPFYFKWYNEKRKTRKIKLRVIASTRKISKIPNSKVRFLPEKYSNPVAINVYGNNTATILWAKIPKAIVIKSREIAKGYRNYFELLWKIARE